MSTRFTLLLSGAAMMAVATPALAHDDHLHRQHVEVVSASGDYDGEWQGHWQDGDTWRGMWNGTFTTNEGEVMEGRYVGTFVGEGRFVTDDGRVLMLGDYGWHEGDGDYGVHHVRRPHQLGASPEGRLGYTMAEREAWLADCRVLMSSAGRYGDYYDYYRDDADGGLSGGLLGAIGGGFAGNRIADGDRLAGTLIGAGIGGLAGVVIGSLIDSDDDDHRETRDIDANELYAARYCDAYLRRYEMGGGAGFHGQRPYGQPMMVQTVAAHAPHGQHGHRHGPECTTTVREEWVEVEQPAPRRARRVIQRQPEPSGKTVLMPETSCAAQMLHGTKILILN